MNIQNQPSFQGARANALRNYLKGGGLEIQTAEVKGTGKWIASVEKAQKPISAFNIEDKAAMLSLNPTPENFSKYTCGNSKFSAIRKFIKGCLTVFKSGLQ